MLGGSWPWLSSQGLSSHPQSSGSPSRLQICLTPVLFVSQNLGWKNTPRPEIIQSWVSTSHSWPRLLFLHWTELHEKKKSSIFLDVFVKDWGAGAPEKLGWLTWKIHWKTCLFDYPLAIKAVEQNWKTFWGDKKWSRKSISCIYSLHPRLPLLIAEMWRTFNFLATVSLNTCPECVPGAWEAEVGSPWVPG